MFIPVLLNKRLPLEMTQGLIALPLYFIGYAFKSPLMDRTPSFKYLIPFAVFLVLNVLITRLHGRVSMMPVHFGELARQFGHEPMELSVPVRLAYMGGDVMLIYLNGIIGSLMILSLTLLPFPKIPFIGTLSKGLITVYGTQFLFLTPVIHTLGYNQLIWASALLSIGIFALCYGLHLILRPAYRFVQ